MTKTEALKAEIRESFPAAEPARLFFGRQNLMLEEVVVTARRREETIQDVPIPVTALSGEDLKDRGAQDLRDLTRVTPNMDFQRAASNKNTAQVFLRGIGQVNWTPTQDPKIGTYLNGVYLGRPQTLSASRCCAGPRGRCLDVTPRQGWCTLSPTSPPTNSISVCPQAWAMTVRSTAKSCLMCPSRITSLPDLR